MVTHRVILVDRVKCHAINAQPHEIGHGYHEDGYGILEAIIWNGNLVSTGFVCIVFVFQF